MRTIHKYALDPNPAIQRITLSKDAQILDVQIQNGVPTLWALVQTESQTELREIRSIGTGHRVPDENLRYISTTQVDDQVWHWFEGVPPLPNDLFNRLLGGETLRLTRQQWLDVKPMFKYTQLLASEDDGMLSCRAENRNLESFLLLVASKI